MGWKNWDRKLSFFRLPMHKHKIHIHFLLLIKYRFHTGHKIFRPLLFHLFLLWLSVHPEKVLLLNSLLPQRCILYMVWLILSVCHLH